MKIQNCCKMRIWLQNFVSIQPRTSLEKSDVSWPTAVVKSWPVRPLAGRRVLLELGVAEARQPTDERLGRRGAALRIAVGHDTSLFSRLVLGCIETKFCNQIRIFSGFSRSTKLSSCFFEKVAKFCKKSQNFAKLLRNFRIFAEKVLIFAKIADFLQNFANFLKI